MIITSRWDGKPLLDFKGDALVRANLYGADLRGTAALLQCPESGSFTGFKKLQNGIIAELEVLSDAKRSSATSRKCRCDKAKVVALTNRDGTPSDRTWEMSQRDSMFVYEIGEIVSVKNFDEDRWNECSTGIHFFITRQEAVEY